MMYSKMEENGRPTEECCPEFDPSKWDHRDHTWKDKLFIRDYVRQIFHIPINFGSVVKRMCAKINAADAQPPAEEYLLLAYDPSPWKSELYMTATREVQGAENVKLSGEFASKVFDGPYNMVPEWIKEMDIYLAGRELKAIKYYFHYAYCPKCAKRYGHNYCVCFAEAEEV